MTLDQIIDPLKADLTEYLISKLVAELLTVKYIGAFLATGVGGLFLAWIVMPAIRWGVEKGVKYLDLGGFYLYKAFKNPKDAEKYQDSVLATQAANESGDRDAFEKAKAEQRRLFVIATSLSA
jgi:hypothetical protein